MEQIMKWDQLYQWLPFGLHRRLNVCVCVCVCVCVRVCVCDIAC